MVHAHAVLEVWLGTALLKMLCSKLVICETARRTLYEVVEGSGVLRLLQDLLDKVINIQRRYTQERSAKFGTCRYTKRLLLHVTCEP